MPVLHHALAMYLQRELERVQERTLSIICAGLDYKEALDVAGIPTIVSYNEGICNGTFTSIITNKEHRLNKLLPAISHNPCSSREHRRSAIPIALEIHSLCPLVLRIMSQHILNCK